MTNAASDGTREWIRNWLADVLDSVSDCEHFRELDLADTCALCEADAILNAPGVEVDTEVGSISEEGNWVLADFRYDTPAKFRRAVIRLRIRAIDGRKRGET